VGESRSCQINGIINSTKGWFPNFPENIAIFSQLSNSFFGNHCHFFLFLNLKTPIKRFDGSAMPIGRYLLFAETAYCRFCTSWIGMRLAWPPNRPMLRSIGRSSACTQSINGPRPLQSIPMSGRSIRQSGMTFRRRRLTPIVSKTNRKMRPSLMLLRFFLKPHLNQSALRTGLPSGQCAECN
jgi:hypothetical protein